MYGVRSGQWPAATQATPNSYDTTFTASGSCGAARAIHPKSAHVMRLRLHSHPYSGQTINGQPPPPGGTGDFQGISQGRGRRIEPAEKSSPWGVQPCFAGLQKKLYYCSTPWGGGGAQPGWEVLDFGKVLASWTPGGTVGFGLGIPCFGVTDWLSAQTPLQGPGEGTHFQKLPKTNQPFSLKPVSHPSGGGGRSGGG